MPVREFEEEIHGGCTNLDAFSQALAKIKAMDAMNLPRGNLVLEKASETIPHAICPIPCGVMKACEAEIGFALKKDVRISFEDLQKATRKINEESDSNT